MEEFRTLRRLEGFPYDQPGQSYFITMRKIRSQPDFTDNSEVAELLLNEFKECCERYGYHPGAGVVMPDHAHFLLANLEGEVDLPEAVRRYKSYTTNCLWDMGYEGEVWQNNFYDRYLRTHREWKDKISYIWKNPQRAGLVRTSRDWPFVRFW